MNFLAWDILVHGPFYNRGIQIIVWFVGMVDIEMQDLAQIEFERS